jgi:hypothetical protein
MAKSLAAIASVTLAAFCLALGCAAHILYKNRGDVSSLTCTGSSRIG